MKESRNRPAAMTDYEMLLLPMGAAILQIMYQHTVNAIVYIITVVSTAALVVLILFVTWFNCH